MKKLMFSITLLSVMAGEIKPENLVERTWETVKATASGAKKSVETLFTGAPKGKVHEEKVMNPDMAKASKKAYDQQHPKETTTADHQAAL